jgi:AcrR family transcriptional regulator
MTLASETTPLLGSHASLRERKKLATRRGIRRVALDLIAERGFSHVTIEDIAAAADVSPRTFFNYFPSKEAVLFGADPGRAEEVRARLVHDLPGHSALEVLRLVLTDRARQLAAELAELGGDPGRWAAQMKAAQADPQLRAAQASHMAQVESSFASALAERLGTDPDRDPYPMLLASTATAVLRATMSFWAAGGGNVPLEQLVDAAFQALADGFPETGALRDLATQPVGPPPAASATGPPPAEVPQATPPSGAPQAAPPSGAPQAAPPSGAPQAGAPRAVTQNFGSERTNTDEHV